VSDALFKKKGLGARVTMRLSERELAALKELAESREVDLTSVIREAIGAYLHQERTEERTARPAVARPNKWTMVLAWKPQNIAYHLR
jgi:predicted transcriptional regulator